MAINVRNTLLRTGVDSDLHYNDLETNEVLTKTQFPSGVHEIISDPTSNQNATREFYQLSILSEAATSSGTLNITDDSDINITGSVSITNGDTDSEITEKLVTVLKAGTRFTNIIGDINTIHFNTIGRGIENNNNLISLNGESRNIADSSTGIIWRIDILTPASDEDENTEVILDAGVWTGI